MLEENVVIKLGEAHGDVAAISTGIADILLGGVFVIPWWNNQDQKAKLQENRHYQKPLYTCFLHTHYERLPYKGIKALIYRYAPIYRLRLCRDCDRNEMTVSKLPKKTR